MNNNSAKEHYYNNVMPLENTELDECEEEIKNIGWTLGNVCPYKCKHCYSLSAREEGCNLTVEMIEKVIYQISKLKVETVNLGGNEPIFTNGINPKDSLLPYIITRLVEEGYKVGLTTSGITAIYLAKYYNEQFLLLNDIDISIDSPIEDEHNLNRGNKIFHLVTEALELCKKYNKDTTLILCAMKWNFTEDRIRKLVSLAKEYNANVRINPIKPIELRHMKEALEPKQYYEGFSILLKLCDSLDLTEPTLAGITKLEKSKRCPCGRTSFRIHSITPEGKIPISPCVYLHDYKIGDLLKDDIMELICSEQFKAFRRRNKHPEKVKGCEGCELLNICGGGCASRAYLYNLHNHAERSLFVKDPMCPKEGDMSYWDFEKNPSIMAEKKLVHIDYLCTWIGKPK